MKGTYVALVLALVVLLSTMSCTVGQGQMQGMKLSAKHYYLLLL